MIRQYIKPLRYLVASVASEIPEEKSFEKNTCNKLNLPKSCNWKLLVSIIDLLEDTEESKRNFTRFGLSGPTKSPEIGEYYLRMYGLLNAIYLQRGAIKELLELSKNSNKKEIIKKINNTMIIRLRHIAGAHTVDFKSYNSGEAKINSIPYQISRPKLSEDVIEIWGNGEFIPYDLKNLMGEYDLILTEILQGVLEKFFNTTLKNNPTKRCEYLDWLNAIESAKNGLINANYTMDGKIHHISILDML